MAGITGAACSKPKFLFFIELDLPDTSKQIPISLCSCPFSLCTALGSEKEV